jgi:predicted dehydrogenase
VAHIPALKLIPDYKLVAVSTTRQESAEAAARFYGLEHAFDDPRALASHPDVDLVVVAVKVPHHLELVTAEPHALNSWGWFIRVAKRLGNLPLTL